MAFDKVANVDFITATLTLNQLYLLAQKVATVLQSELRQGIKHLNTMTCFDTQTT